MIEHKTTILTVSGRYFDYLNPAAVGFDLADIGHGLGMVARFAGQCPQFYSVAQHSVYVASLVPPEHRMAALFHDAPEAFACDIPKPLKMLIPQYDVIEDAIEAAIFEFFAIPLPLPACVKEADRIMLATEQKVLRDNDDRWKWTGGALPVDMQIPHMDPAQAKAFWLRAVNDVAASGKIDLSHPSPAPDPGALARHFCALLRQGGMGHNKAEETAALAVRMFVKG